MTNSVLDTFLELGEVVPKPGHFDPMSDVPVTDEQVKYSLSVRPDNVGDSMWGFYCCERKLGKPVLDAWESTLLMSLN